MPEVFLSTRQTGPDALELVIRTNFPNPLGLWPEIVRAISQLDPDVPLYDFRTMDWYMNYQTADRRFLALMSSVFAAMALLLAGIGIYGLMAYLVSQRKKEFGIRIALGARTTNITSAVLRQGLQLVLPGLALGLIAAFCVARLLAALLFDVTPADTLTFAAASLVLLAISALACWLPARRAASVDPAIILRAD